MAIFFLVAIHKGSADEEITPKVVVEKTLEEKILDALPKVFIKIGKAESGLDPKAVNWNCRYYMPTNSDPNRHVSRPCLPADRQKAWSVDCGIFQVNAKGTECPESLFDVDINISKTKELYDARGLQPWDASFNMWITS